jgi:hypothetical protein
MAFSFAPALWRSGTSYTSPSGTTRTTTVNSGQLFFLPQPITAFPLLDDFKGRVEEMTAKVGGNAVRGNRHAHKQVSITGLYGKHLVSTETALLTELQMLDLHRDLLEFLNPDEPTQEHELFIYYDSGTSTYRKYKQCFKSSLSTDIGDAAYANKIFTMNLQMIILDPVIYTTGPGA